MMYEGVDTGADTDAVQQQQALPSTRVELEPIGLTAEGQRYRVTYAGETLVEGVRNPIFDACRALLARGITGRLEVWRPGKPSAPMQLDIEKGAGAVIVETAAQSLRVASVSLDPSKRPAATAAVGNTYDSPAEAEADRAQQKQLLTALNGWDRALRRDECGAWTIIGKQRSIHTWGDRKSWVLFVACQSKVGWTRTKRRLSFCTVTQDGEDEGCLRLHQLPMADQAAVIRKVLGIRKRQEFSEEQRQRLIAAGVKTRLTGKEPGIADAFLKRGATRGQNRPNIALGDRPVPDGHLRSEAKIFARIPRPRRLRQLNGQNGRRGGDDGSQSRFWALLAAALAAAYCGVELGAVARASLRQSRSGGRYFYAFQALLSSRTAKTHSGPVFPH